MLGNKIHIVEKFDVEKGRIFKITIDGVELHGVRELCYSSDVESMPTLSLEMVAFDTEIEVEELNE